MKPLFAFALLAALAVPCTARGADIDDLKAAHEASVKALNARDAQGWAAGFYEWEIRFAATDPFPTDRERASLAPGMQEGYAVLESRTTTPVNLQYRVIGNTGLVWGYHRDTLKPKDGQLQSYLARCLLVYVKTDGKWLRAASHFSAMPSGNW